MAHTQQLGNLHPAQQEMYIMYYQSQYQPKQEKGMVVAWSCRNAPGVIASTCFEIFLRDDDDDELYYYYYYYYYYYCCFFLFSSSITFVCACVFVFVTCLSCLFNLFMLLHSIFILSSFLFFLLQ